MVTGSMRECVVSYMILSVRYGGAAVAALEGIAFQEGLFR